jgi:hypothetical protein
VSGKLKTKIVVTLEEDVLGWNDPYRAVLREAWMFLNQQRGDVSSAVLSVRRLADVDKASLVLTLKREE